MADLYEQLCTWDNLCLAYRKAARGKRGMAPAAAFEYCLEDNLLCLQNQFRDGTYRPGRYNSFHVHEPKRRLISAAPFRDRVVHHALCNVIEPLFERRFIYDSYANRVGKGTHQVICTYAGGWLIGSAPPLTLPSPLPATLLGTAMSPARGEGAAVSPLPISTRERGRG